MCREDWRNSVFLVRCIAMTVILTCCLSLSNDDPDINWFPSSQDFDIQNWCEVCKTLMEFKTQQSHVNSCL